MSKRVEFAYLRHAWKWAADGAIILWVVYNHHLTEEAAAFFAKNSRSVDVWALPGKHLGEYDQIIVAAIKGTQPEPGALYNAILREKAEPHPLVVQTQPVYRVPPPPDPNRKFVFAPDMIDEAQGLRLIADGGAWRSNAFQALLQTPPPPGGHRTRRRAASGTSGAGAGGRRGWKRDGFLQFLKRLCE